jgi:hypothetical protein
MKIYSAKLQQFAAIVGIAIGSIGSSGAITPANALTFNFNPAAGTSQLAIDGFKAAGALWSSVLTDNVTININIDFKKLAPGVLGETSSTEQLFSYNQVRTALNSDKSSTDDSRAVGSLSSNSSFNMLLNRTANSPNGNGSATPYLDDDGDANNSQIRMTNANAKALGLETTVASDADISFSSLFTWDFDRSNGISANAYDFIGVAAHEIGHALGFISGVDILDSNSLQSNDPFRRTLSSSDATDVVIGDALQANSAFADNVFNYVNTLDLFRYSTDSTAQGAIDWTADKRDKYFSLDGGKTKIASFSTGETYGDGRQASHWKDNIPSIGIMDPTGGLGELLTISELDLQGFDVIGWNRVAAANATSIPEPSNFIGTVIFAAIGAKMMLKRRQKLIQAIEKET